MGCDNCVAVRFVSVLQYQEFRRIYVKKVRWVYNPTNMSNLLIRQWYIEVFIESTHRPCDKIN